MAPAFGGSVPGPLRGVNLEAYESAVGWCFWSYRTEQAGDWNFRHLVETGIVRL